jgi:predicted Zn-dependent peptidase
MRPLSISSAPSILSACLLAAATSLSAQTLDRTTPPTLSPPVALHLPPVSTEHLASGAALYLVEMHKVPLVQVTLRLRAGGRYDGAHPGIASFTANMLTEGAGTRDAAGVASQIAYLGARLDADAGWDYTTVSLSTPVRTLGAALDLMADLVLRPRFGAADIRREKNLRIADIVEARSEPSAMASLAFNAVVFPAGHPYHRPLEGDSSAVAAFDSASVRAFYRRTYVPRGAEFIVTGDITPAEAARQLNRHFAGWPAGTGTAPVAATGATPAPEATAITLVNKTGAAQSAIIIGGPGVERSNPDFAALEVMNTLLGGSYSSRINQNLRETHGYTYGAGSDFVYRPLPGPFEAEAAVRTDVTDSSLAQFFIEFHSIRDSLVSDVELHRAINYINLGLPGQFETTDAMARNIGTLLTFHLPLDYYNGFASRISAITAADVQRVARRYLDPAHISVVVVGDVSVIRAGIESLGLGPVRIRPAEGAPASP